MDENKIQRAVEIFCSNPYWNEYYETAPTETCKRYIELKFYFSEYGGEIPDYDDFKSECVKIEKEFIKVDWEHLYKYCGNNPKKVYYKRKIESYL